MAKFSQTFLQGLLNPSYQQGLFEAARSVGQAPGIMAMQERREDRQNELNKLYGPLFDPSATPEQLFQTAQSLNKMGKSSEAMQVLTYARDMQKSAQEQQQLGVLKEQVATQAEGMGLPELAKQVRLVTNMERLQSLSDALNERQMETMPDLSVGGRRRVLLDVGYTPQFVGTLDLKNMSKQEFNSYKDLMKGDVEMFIDSQGNAEAYKVTDNGMIVIDGQLVDPQNAGLRVAPNEQVVKNVTGPMADKLATLGAESFAELKTQADKSVESIRSIDNVIGDIDTMFTGTLANINLNVNKFLKSVGINVDVDPIEQTEVFLAESAKRVADYITNLGSGTGLSDKDLQFTRQVVAGEITLDANTIKRMLTEFRDASARKIESYNSVRENVQTKLGDEQSSALVFYPPVIAPSAQKDSNRFKGFSIVTPPPEQ